MNIENILAEREKSYGLFKSHAALSQELKLIMRASLSWPTLSPDKKESLEMIAHKIARILNGNPGHHDSWCDIEGYAKLVADTLEVK
jgi:hypothetical protein